ncbi:hypothetical protein GGI05_005996, partial [Coemansia sp. RSA 2603]
PTVVESTVEDVGTVLKYNDNSSIESVHTTSPDISRTTDHVHEAVDKVSSIDKDDENENNDDDDEDNMPIMQAINRNAQVDDDKPPAKTDETATI